MAEANWGQTGIQWGLFAPQQSNQGGNAFSSMEEAQARREAAAEQRRQFDASHGLRQQEFNQRQSQHGETYGIARQDLDLRRGEDARKAETHKLDTQGKQNALDEDGFRKLSAINDVVQSAQTPGDQAAVIALGKQLGMKMDPYASPNGYRILQERMRRDMVDQEAKRAAGAAGMRKTESEGIENYSKADLNKAQADAIRQKQEDPVDALIRQRIQGMQQQQPRPQGGLQQQSAPVEQGDPNLIQAQGAQPQAQQQQMVEIPGIGPVPMEVAGAMALKAARDKNQPLADMISQAIGKVPKALQDDVAKKQMEAIDQIGRLEGIKARFKPEWQTYETSLKQRGLNIADSFETLRDRIPENERQTMAEYTSFKMEAIDNLNRYIKEMTGAAMSELEAKRLRQGLPDPEKDGPTQFKAKLDNSIRLSKLTHARYKMIGKDGVSQYTPIEVIPDLINKRAGLIEQQFRQQNPGATQPLVDQAVRQHLKQEFGI